jgi:electron transfer flavoprotein alpha subunit
MPEEKKVKKPLGVARPVEGRCIACGSRCLTVCPKHAVGITDQGVPLVDITRCTGCRRCIKICPAEALEIYYTPEQLKLLEEIAALGQKAEQQEEGEECGFSWSRQTAYRQPSRGNCWV